MAITAISYSEKHWFVSKEDPDRLDPETKIPWTEIDAAIAAGATVWEWGAIPNSVMCRINDAQQTTTVEVGDMAGVKQTFNQKSAYRNRESFRWGLKNVWNFAASDGSVAITFENVLEGGQQCTIVSDAFINRVPLSVMQEVGTEIFNGNSLTEGQRKNLEAVLSRFDGSQSGDAMVATVGNALKEAVNKGRSRKGTSRSKAKKLISTGQTR